MAQQMIDKTDINLLRRAKNKLDLWLGDNADAEVVYYESVARQRNILSVKITNYERTNTPQRVRPIKD